MFVLFILVGKLDSMPFTRHPPILQIGYMPAWLGVRQGEFTCVTWQITLCDPIWQVTLCSSEMGFHDTL